MMATYGHLLNSSIVVYISIYQQVSFFMLLNLIVVAFYYMIATRGLERKSQKHIAESGLLS